MFPSIHGVAPPFYDMEVNKDYRTANWSASSRRPYRGGVTYKSKLRRRAFKRACRPEQHYIDVANAPALIPAGGVLQCINQIASGDDYNQRSGRVVINSYIQYDILVLPPTNAGVNDQYNLAFIWDAQPNNALAAYNQPFDMLTHHIGMEFKNLAQFANRFTILKTIKGSVSEGSPDLPRRYRGFIKLPIKCMRSIYAGAAAGVPESGAILFGQASFNNTGLAATTCSLTCSFRVGFHEC